MVDKRAFYKTKTFWGFIALAGGMVAHNFGLQPLGELLMSAGALWSGYSIADRLRK